MINTNKITRSIAIWLMFVTALLMVSCCPEITSHTDTKRTDKIITTVTPRPIEVKVPEKEMNVLLNIECDPVTNKPVPVSFISDHEGGSVKIMIDSTGLMLVKARFDSLMAVVYAKDSTIKYLSTLETDTTDVITKYKTRTIDIICRSVTGLFALVLGFKLLKLFKPDIL